MINNYMQYISYLKKSNKKLWIIFFVSLLVMIACFSSLAIFSPDDRQFAIGMCIFALLVYGFVHIIGFYNYVKAVNFLDDNVEEDTIHMNMTTYYNNELVKSGWFFLTKTEFIFIDLDKKLIPIRIQIDEVNAVEYDFVFRRIKGLIIIKTDGVKANFAFAPKEFENIKKIFNTIKYRN